jgi:hypothetical protein
MPLPTVDTNIVNEALGLLTGQFASDATTPNVRNLVRAKANRWQDLENTLWAVINSTQLLLPPSKGGPTGQALDQLGALVGEPRGAFNDTQFQLFIRVIIAARKSGGRAEDLMKVLQLALGLGAFGYNEYNVGRVDVYAPNIVTDLYAAPLAQALTLARPPGVFCEFSYYDATYSEPIFVLGDTVSGTGGSGFQDQESLSSPTLPISSLVF